MVNHKNNRFVKKMLLFAAVISLSSAIIVHAAQSPSIFNKNLSCKLKVSPTYYLAQSQKKLQHIFFMNLFMSLVKSYEKTESLTDLYAIEQFLQTNRQFLMQTDQYGNKNITQYLDALLDARIFNNPLRHLRTTYSPTSGSVTAADRARFQKYGNIIGLLLKHGAQTYLVKAVEDCFTGTFRKEVEIFLRTGSIYTDTFPYEYYKIFIDNGALKDWSKLYTWYQWLRRNTSYGLSTKYLQNFASISHPATILSWSNDEFEGTMGGTIYENNNIKNMVLFLESLNSIPEVVTSPEYRAVINNEVLPNLYRATIEGEGAFYKKAENPDPTMYVSDPHLRLKLIAQTVASTAASGKTLEAVRRRFRAAQEHDPYNIYLQDAVAILDKACEREKNLAIKTIKTIDTAITKSVKRGKGSNRKNPVPNSVIDIMAQFLTGIDRATATEVAEKLLRNAQAEPLPADED